MIKHYFHKLPYFIYTVAIHFVYIDHKFKLYSQETMFNEFTILFGIIETSALLALNKIRSINQSNLYSVNVNDTACVFPSARVITT